MSTPIINDFRKPQLTKTEKAIAVLESDNQMIKNWNLGLQRQIATLMIKLKIKPDEFVQNTRDTEEINKFLQEAQVIENNIIKAEQAKQDEQISKIEEFNVNSKTEEPSKSDSGEPQKQDSKNS